ncbi:DUF2490 domain-containing protein [Hymenobacter lutimineralis]|uniref:DUF2490 domain-containing protein n=1 Tax=Hymenobacter lutimineralis TaxID=2606448 RepID=A0A5D6UYD4_9BACT|nr:MULTISPECIES: DUF2490 domain-containing protein [Hymenobacter]QIX63168.1 DUF2490 domain-containing protein [Hymenobacter sp. BT18]TYZ07858.1 DUF2490 domain-containing protein [Hymenobacter lutimineralis]
MNKAVCAVGLLGAMVGKATLSRAQTPGTWGSWFIGTVQLPGTPEKKWGGFGEVQVRTNGLFSQYFYHELKGGVSYDLDKNFTVMLAGGRYATYKPKEVGEGPLNTEARLWLQITLNQYMARLRVEHRYRLEQRWFNYSGDSTGTRNRLRYRLNTFLPLNKSAIGPGTVFLSVYDEIFLNPKGPVFERNRVYAGAGYQFNKHLTAQAGWVNQANYNLPAYKQGHFVPQVTSAKHNVVLALTYRLAHRAATAVPEHLPSQQD